MMRNIPLHSRPVVSMQSPLCMELSLLHAGTGLVGVVAPHEQFAHQPPSRRCNSSRCRQRGGSAASGHLHLFHNICFLTMQLLGPYKFSSWFMWSFIPLQLPEGSTRDMSRRIPSASSCRRPVMRRSSTLQRCLGPN